MSLIGILTKFIAKSGKLPILLITFLLISFLAVGIGLTAVVTTFQWDANTEPDLAGYRLYQSNVSGSYAYGPTSPDLIATVPAGQEEVSIEINDGTYFWVATAFDTGGLESDPSNEITATLNGPPGCPKLFRFK